MARSRQALIAISHGLSQGARAFSEGMKQFGQAISMGGVALKNVGIICKKFGTDTVRAHYNLAGKYTFPFEQELAGKQPPKISDLNVLGQVTLIPVIVPTLLLSVSVIPLFGNSIQSIPHGFVDVANLAMADFNEEDKIPYPPEYRTLMRKMYGAPGYIVGGVAGSPIALCIGAVRVISNSMKSISITFVPIVNLALAPEDNGVLPADQRNTASYILGVPGLAIGVVFGAIGLIGVFISRVLINSITSTGYYFNKTLNFVLPYDVNNPLVINDNRSRNSFLLGMPGILFGVILGGISALFVSSAITTGRVFIASLNSVLADNDRINIRRDQRGMFAKVIGALPGVILGGIFGELCALFIGIARVIINSCKSFIYFFKQGLRLGLPAEQQFIIDNDDRESDSKWLGAPGAILGSCLGFISTAIASSAISLLGSFLTVTNFALHANDKFIVGPDTRSWLGTILGGPGLLIGGIAGVFSAVAVLIARIAINSCNSFLYCFAYGLRLGLPAEQQFIIEDDRDHTSKWLGAPGAILGSCLGFISTAIASSAISLLGSFLTVTNFALHANDKFIVGPDTRSWLGTILGGSGLLIGSIAGVFSAVAVLIARIAINSCKSFIYFFQHGLQLGLPAEQQFIIDEDDRDHTSKWLGAPGAILGSTLGFISTVIASSTISLLDSFLTVTNFALHANDKIIVGPDTRSWLGTILGGPGLLIGGIAGVFSALTVALGRIMINSSISWLYFFKSGLNVGLPTDEHIAQALDTRDSNTKWLGLPGALMGGGLGLVTAFFMSTAITAEGTWKVLTNLSLHDEHKFIVGNDNRSTPGKILGVLGIIPGGIFGVVSAFVILCGHSYLNGKFSFTYHFRNAINLGLPPAQHLTLAVDNRPRYKQIAGLFPNGFMGALLGGIVASCISTAFTTVRTFKNVTNWVLPSPNEFNVADDNRCTFGKVLGGFGYLFGGIVGLLSAFSVALGRLFSNNVKSFTHFFKLALNIGLPSDYRVAAVNNRDLTSHLFGLPGLVMGSVFGIVTAAFISTAITTVRTFKNVTNVALPRDYEFNVTDDKRSAIGKIIGGFGYLLGVIAGLLSAFSVALVRLLSNSVKSFAHFFKVALNIGLPADYRVTAINNRDLSSHLFGLPGLVMGSVVGIVAAAFISTAITTVRTFKNVTNVVLPAGYEFNIAEDKRSITGKIIGGFGYLLGGIAGMLGAFSVALVRLLSNTVKSFAYFFKLVLNIGLPADYRVTVINNRNLPGHLFGLPGLVTGSLFGGVAAWFISSGITAVRTFVRTTNLVLDAEYEISLSPDKRSTLGICLGVLGLIPGLVAGIISAFLVSCTRIFFNTSVSALRYMQIVSNYGLPLDQQFEIAEDGRSNSGKIMGFVGIGIGVLFGAIGAVFISSLQTFGRTFAAMFNYPWDTMNISTTPDNRSTTGKILGVFGFPFGLIVGFVGMLVPASVRMVYESGIFGALSFQYLSNLALHPEDRMLIEPYESNLAAKFYGIPGFIIGGVLGAVSAVLIMLCRLVSQTCQNWFYLSGSFMNCGLGWRMFEGLSIDRRSWQEKTSGGLGYVLALATTLPLAALIFTVRHTPLIASVILGFSVSPLILVWRSCSNALNYLYKKDRFAQVRPNGELIINDRQSIIQGFKNIYSSLNTWGNFTPGPGNYIAYDADGSKNHLTFFRKCVTFNTNSVTERTLNELLAAYKLYAARDQGEGYFGADFFDRPEFDNVVKDLNEYYEDGCFDTAKEIAEIKMEIKSISDFVKTYMKDRINQERVEIEVEVVPPGGMPFNILFFGERQVEPVAAVVPQVEFDVNNDGGLAEVEGAPVLQFR